MRRNFILLLAFFLFAYLYILPGNLQAAPYYQGKVLKIIVGWGPGGGTDRLARLISKHLPRHIPGAPRTIVQNMPGASSVVAANYLYNEAKRDGLSVGAFTGGILLAQLFKPPGVKFDLAKFSWIGSAAIESTILFVRTDLPYKTASDIQKATSPLILGYVGLTETSGQFPTLLKAYAGLNIKLVRYPSGADVQLAVRRKEVDGRASYYSSVKPEIEEGFVRPLIRSRVSLPGIENIAVDEDLATSKIGKTVMAMRASQDLIGRPYIAPPGTPADLVKTLKKAFENVAKDPELIKDAKKFMMPVTYVSAEESLKTLNFLLNQPEDVVKEFSEYIKF